MRTAAIPRAASVCWCLIVLCNNNNTKENFYRRQPIAPVLAHSGPAGPTRVSTAAQKCTVIV